jgi:hypothetical protein
MVDQHDQVTVDLPLDALRSDGALVEFANRFQDPMLQNQLMAMDAFMLEQPQVDIPVRHYFAPGVYAREITAPAGTIVSGKVHKTEHLNIMSKGEISVLTEDGVKRFKAPYTFVSKPGTKRIAYVHEEMVWTTVHHTHETDVAKIECDLVQDNFESISADDVARITQEN